MAQRYITALDYADKNAKRVLKKHAKNRPLGEIESKHRYTPPQPVLSCRTVDIDVSGTRTYRPRSTTDILAEQHRLIHNIYTKQRNITSAPPQRSTRTTSTNRNEDFHQYQRLNIQVHGRPLTSQSQATIIANNNASQKTTVRRRPNSTGTIKQSNRKNYMVLHVDQDLVETSRSTKELTKVIHEQWLPEKHNLNQGKFQRGQSKSEVPSGQDTWLTFGGAPTDDSSGVIDAFAKFKENEDFYTIEGNVGSCVAQRIQTGDKIRIGINGRLQSENLKVKKWIKEKKDSLEPVEEKAEKETMEKKIIPLCWDDEITGVTSKVISPREQRDDGPKPSLCETHPVFFTNEKQDEKQRPKIMSRQDGFKVKHRPKSGASIDGNEKENKIVVITIDKKSEEEENKLNGISVDDVLKSSLSAKNAKTSENKVKTDEKGEIKENGDICDPSVEDDIHIENLRSASKISMTESQISVTSDHSRTPKYKSVSTHNYSRQSTADLSVGPMSGSTARIDSAKSNQSGSEKSLSSSRVSMDRQSSRQSSKKQGQTKPVFRAVSMAPFSPQFGTEGETEYIQIAQQLRNPKPYQKHDSYITQSVSDEAIRQVGRKNKISSADSRKRAPPTTPVIPIETPREIINEDIPENIAESPVPSPTTIKPSTPTVSISIPTAESIPDRDSAPNSPWPSHRENLDSVDILSKQQKRELSMRDSQIDHLTSLLGDALIASENMSEKENGVQEKSVTFKEGS